MSKPITLYTFGTPNGYPIAVALEELDVPYDVKFMSFEDKEQRSDWFLKLNPNGRIPVIVDHENAAGDFAVFETSAILLYLAQHYDLEHKISYDPVKETNLHSEELQWLFFAHGGIGPMWYSRQGQATHFFRYAPEKIPYAIKRYIEETKRLFSILENRLEGREWLVGPHYGLADIKTLVALGPWSGVDLDAYPNLQAWLERIRARPKTHEGLGVPVRTNLEEYLKNADKVCAQVAAYFQFEK